MKPQDISRDQIQELKKEYPEGTRLRVDNMQDPRPVPAGTLGTVFHVDDLGQIHVRWDNGSTLALIQSIDRFEKV